MKTDSKTNIQKPINLVSHELSDKKQERHESTEYKKKVNDFRRNILGMVYDIQNLDVLNYIKIIIEDIAKEDKKSGVIDEQN